MAVKNMTLDPDHVAHLINSMIVAHAFRVKARVVIDNKRIPADKKNAARESFDLWDGSYESAVRQLRAMGIPIVA